MNSKMKNKEIGRPTKLNPELHGEIVDLIRAGNYVETSCAVVGISKNTFYEWIKKGEKPGRNNKYTRFRADVEKAKAWSEARDVLIIAKHSEKNWKAAAWKLEKKYPARWKKDREVIESPEIKDVYLSDWYSPENIAECVEKVVGEMRKKQEESNPEPEDGG